MTRIYKVEGPLPETTRLVRAANRAQAIRHVTRSEYSAVLAGQDDLIELIQRGVAVEDAATTEESEE